MAELDFDVVTTAPAPYTVSYCYPEIHQTRLEIKHTHVPRIHMTVAAAHYCRRLLLLLLFSFVVVVVVIATTTTIDHQ